MHLLQACLRNAGDMGLKPWMIVEPFIRRVVALCCALPLLPDFYIDEAFTIVGEEAMTIMSPALYEIVRPFFVYFWNTWINSQSRRTRLSVFGCIHRTNNVCECHNRWLKDEVGTHQPNVYWFIG